MAKKIISSSQNYGRKKNGMLNQTIKENVYERNMKEASFEGENYEKI